MSYPELRYHGDTGEASATLRPATAPLDVTGEVLTEEERIALYLRHDNHWV